MSLQAEMIQKQLLEANMEEGLDYISNKIFAKPLKDLSDKEAYYVILLFTKDLTLVTDRINGEKKVFYISAEFLIGRLLSNNLINLGIYDKVAEVLKKNGKDISIIEEVEPEPSLGNGGLGRLAACFMDSIATLGLPGAGIGLNYHYGLFKQEFRDNLQCAEKNDWIEDISWLRKTDTSFTVEFGDCAVKSRLYDIDVIGYENGINKLHLFDLESVDEKLVKKGITFDKEAIEKNLTLFLYPDDSDEAGNLLRIYQQYFMCSNAAQFILYELRERKYDLRHMSATTTRSSRTAANSSAPAKSTPSSSPPRTTSTRPSASTKPSTLLPKHVRIQTIPSLRKHSKNGLLSTLKKLCPNSCRLSRNSIKESRQNTKIPRLPSSIKMIRYTWLTSTSITDIPSTVLQPSIPRYLRTPSSITSIRSIPRSSTTRPTVSPSEDGSSPVTKNWHSSCRRPSETALPEMPRILRNFLNSKITTKYLIPSIRSRSLRSSSLLTT